MITPETMRCAGDAEPCYVGAGTDDARWRCGTVQCGCEGTDDEDEDEYFDCHMGPDGLCGSAGSEWCDFQCPTMRAFRRGEIV